MFMPIVSGLIVSVDAFFIGLSLGMQKRCKFLYLVLMNVFLAFLCFLGYVLAGHVYELIPVDPDIIVGMAFILLGLWTMAQYFIFERIKQRRGIIEGESSVKAFLLVGLVMSVEAMMITMGIVIIFLPDVNLMIPVTVALAHFGYSALSFFLARSKFAKKISIPLSYVIAGMALIIYGLMALFVEISI